MSTAKRRVRFRWRRSVTILIALYLMYWSGVSVHHMLVIRHQEQGLSQKIAAVKAQNHVLHGDINELHNSAKLKQILTGKAPLPNPNGQP